MTTRNEQPREPRTENGRTSSVLDKYLSLNEVAEFFGVSRSVVRHLREQEGLPVIRMAKGAYFVHEDDLDRWLRARAGKRPAERGEE